MRLRGGSHRYVSTALEGVLGDSGTGVREVRRRVPPLRFTALEGVLGESGTGVREVKRRVQGRLPPLRLYSIGGGAGRERDGG